MPLTPIQVLEDGEGSVAIGWVGDGALYARFVGGLSADVGAAFAHRLQGFVTQVSSVQYFADASALQHYDLDARSAFVRVVLANRRRFSALVMLTWAEGLSPIARAFAAVVGEPIDILTDAAEFEMRLLRAAPFANRKLDPMTWIRPAAPLWAPR